MLPAAAKRPSRVEALRLRGGVQRSGVRGGRSVGKRDREFRSARKRFVCFWAERPLSGYLSIVPDNRRPGGRSDGKRAAGVAEAAAFLVGGVGAGVVTVVVMNTGCGRRRRVDRARVEPGHLCKKQSDPRSA